MSLFYLIVRIAETIFMVAVVIASVIAGIWFLHKGDIYKAMLIIIAGQILSCLGRIMLDHSNMAEDSKDILEIHKDRRRAGWHREY